jgi:spermidine/putrescine transport system permease protein
MRGFDTHPSEPTGRHDVRHRPTFAGDPLSFVHRHKGLIPYLLLGPGLAWLALFFVVPLGFLGHQSLEKQDPILLTYTFKWAWHNYSNAITEYHAQLLRSFGYAAIATALALLISYPLAYWIAFRGGRWKNVLLLFIIGPFFVTYLIRTLAWETILSDEGFVANTLRHLHLLAADGRLLATSTAVVAGITYNFLPFMALPLYVSLEQIDKRLIEAAEDLYASKALAFLRVTLPLSLPGVFAGTLLTFIPAAGDFINAQLLGTPRQYMIGNVIQSKFLELTDYPAAAALSFVLIATILVLVFAYARALGTEKLTG